MLLNIILSWTCVSPLLVAIAFTRRVEISLKHFSTTVSISPVFSIRDLPSSSLYRCVQECRSRQHCRAMTFFKKNSLCRLGGVGLGYMYDKDIYTLKGVNGIKLQDFLGPCANKVCPLQHQCIVLSNNQTTCLMRECRNLHTKNTGNDGFSAPFHHKSWMAALGKVSTALNRSCPAGQPGPNIQVDIKCKTGGWSQIKDITCYDCDAPYYHYSQLTTCFKQMAVNQTYRAAKEQCELNYTLPIIGHSKYRSVIQRILNECTWIDAKYDVGSGKWVYESGKNFAFIDQQSDYRGTPSQYSSTTRQVLCPDGVFEFRDESLTAGTICGVY